MSNYANTKATIAANVYTNHNNEVTAAMVKAGINAVVDTLIAGGYLWAGVAHPGDAASTPDANVVKVATEVGTYTNYKNSSNVALTVAAGEVAVFTYNGSWSKEVTGAATAAEVTALGQEVEDIAETIEDIEIDPESVNENEIVIETDGGVEVVKIDENGVSAGTLEAETLRVKDNNDLDIFKVQENPTETDPEEVEITDFYGTIAKVDANGIKARGFAVIDGEDEREILAHPTKMTYAEIGDSITYLADNKYETSYDDTGTTETGYKGWGYGRYLCKYLGIPYENHYPQGANGRGFSTYAKEWIVDGHWSFPDNINVWTIFLGTNDWGLARTPLGTKDDYIGNTWTTSNQTTYGAIRKIVDKIRSQNTNGDPPQIIFITPLQRGAFLYGSTQAQAESVFVKSAITINSDGEYEYTQNAYGYTLKDVVDAILWVCEYESFKCVDWFNNSIFDKASLNMAQTFADAGWSTTNIFGDVEIEGMRDNLHPLPGGKIYKLMGARLANEISDRFQDCLF